MSSTDNVVLAPQPAEAELKNSQGVVLPPSDEPSPLSSSTTPSEAAPVSDKQRIEELEKINKKQEQRIKDLELALAESRKVIRDRESLLTQVQWKPKDDFYLWKNPKITDKQVRDSLEQRMKTLIDQMRVMEKVLVEREQEIEVLYGNTVVEGTDSPMLAQSLGSSGTFASPMQSPRIVNPASVRSPQMQQQMYQQHMQQYPHTNWMRSPMASPMASPVASPSMGQPKKKWWSFGGGSQSNSRRNSLSDSSGRVPCPPAHMVPSAHNVPSPQVRAAPVTMVNV